MKKSYFIVINKPDPILKILAFGKLYHPALILPLKVLRAVETACLMNFDETSVRELSRGHITILRIASLVSGKLRKIRYVLLFYHDYVTACGSFCAFLKDHSQIRPRYQFPESWY